MNLKYLNISDNNIRVTHRTSFNLVNSMMLSRESLDTSYVSNYETSILNYNDNSKYVFQSNQLIPIENNNFDNKLFLQNYRVNFQHKNYTYENKRFLKKNIYNIKKNYKNNILPSLNVQVKSIDHKPNDNTSDEINDNNNNNDNNNFNIKMNNENSHFEDRIELNQKTPMFLISELARFNKISLQYILEDETGPAHNKIFFVKLKLGNEEEYKANGSSIKKAQQAAAKIALDNTKFRLPNKRKKEISFDLPPTVQLNTLAMKFGYEAKYILTINHNRMNRTIFKQIPNDYNTSSYSNYPNNNLNYKRNTNQVIYSVNLHIGNKSYYGEGKTRKLAKNAAASQALDYLSSLNLPEKKIQDDNNDKRNLINNNLNHSINQIKKEDIKNENNDNQIILESQPKAFINKNIINNSECEKSEISLVHEQANKRNLKEKYEIIQESGPSHIKTYITRCVIGDFETTGEGKSKKESKKNAAKKMIEELKKECPNFESPGTQDCNLKDKKKQKKRVKNIIRIIKENPDYGKGSLNPICRLIQIQQANKSGEPLYELIEEKKKFRCHEFTVQVTVGEFKCIGIGSSKKKAKQIAAQAMLIQLGFQPMQQPQQLPKPVLKNHLNKINRNNNNNENSFNEKKVKFVDVSDDEKTENQKDNFENGQLVSMYKEKQQHVQIISKTLIIACLIAKDYLNKGYSEISDNLKELKKNKVHNSIDNISNNNNNNNNNDDDNANPACVDSKENSNTNHFHIIDNYKEMLLHIAELLEFDVKFQSLTKKNEIRSYVIISILSLDDMNLTGEGKTPYESQNNAAYCALKYLSDKYNKISTDNEPKIDELLHEYSTSLKFTSNLSIDKYLKKDQQNQNKINLNDRCINNLTIPA